MASEVSNEVGKQRQGLGLSPEQMKALAIELAAAMPPEKLREQMPRPKSVSLNDELTIGREELGWVMDAMLIGLTCYGAIEESIETGLPPPHPTGAIDVTSKFAIALTVLNSIGSRPRPQEVQP